MKRIGLLFAIAAVAFSQPLPLSLPEKEGFSEERLKRVHEALEQLSKEGKRSGAIAMVVRNGRIADWHTSGYRDVDSKLPMTKDTICSIYSMSKPITSVAVLMLVEQGKIALTDRLDKFVPEFADVRVFESGTPDDPKLVAPRRPITIKQLLTHTSGMIYAGTSQSPAVKFYERTNVFNATSLREFAAAVAKLPLAAHPGEEWNYGVSTDILGYVVEVASGMPFEHFLEKRIFTPLKMQDTFFKVPDDKASRAARIYAYRGEKLTALPVAKRTMPSGGGGLYSTIGDYARFAQMLLNGGQLDGTRILSRKTVELVMDNHLNHMKRTTISGNDYEGFGLGGSVRIDLAKGNRPGSIGEFGWAGAASTFFRIDPKERMAAILFMQHMPMDAAIQQKFATLVYQSIID